MANTGRPAASTSSMPPSHLESGSYEWIVPLHQSIPFVSNPLKAGLLPKPSDLHKQDSSTHIAMSNACVNENRNGRVGAACVKVDGDVEGIIATCIPDQEGYRNRCLWKLCRRLKGHPDYKDKKADALREVVKAWHQMALPFIRTKEFADTWVEFCASWHRVKTPWGQHLNWDTIMADLNMDNLPPGIQRLRRGSQAAGGLVPQAPRDGGQQALLAGVPRRRPAVETWRT